MQNLKYIKLASGQEVRFGRNHPDFNAPKFHLKNYLVGSEAHKTRKEKLASPSYDLVFGFRNTGANTLNWFYTPNTTTANLSVIPFPVTGNTTPNTAPNTAPNTNPSTNTAPTPVIVSNNTVLTTTCGYMNPTTMNCINQMYGNDTLGDCVEAMMGHAEGTFLLNAQSAISIPTNNQVVELYSAITGYIPGDPNTDQGTDEVSALNYWTNNVIFPSSSKAYTWLSIDATNQKEVETAIWLFENVMFGVDLPDAWVNAMPTMTDGFVWRVAGAADPSNGHAFYGADYNSDGIIIATWAMWGTITWAAIAKYCVAASGGGLYTVLTQDIINKASQKAPNAFDWAQLEADLSAV